MTCPGPRIRAIGEWNWRWHKSTSLTTDAQQLLDFVNTTRNVIIPQIKFEHVLSSGHTLVWCEFPLALAYSMTFHTREGLALGFVGINLTQPVFTHGQLYMALSRVRCTLKYAYEREKTLQQTSLSMIFFHPLN